jgi:hypothetical protein
MGAAISFWRATPAAGIVFAGAQSTEGGPTLSVQVIRAGKAVKLYWNLSQNVLNSATGSFAPALYDPPLLPQITIVDPNGATQVSAAAMTKETSGVYSYEYVTSAGGALGIWSAWVDTTDALGNPAGSASQANQTKGVPVFQLV